VAAMAHAGVWLAALTLSVATFTLEAIRDDGFQEHSELRLTYARPMPGHGKLSAGYELKYDDNRYHYEDARGFTAADLAPVPALANDYRYQQTINAGYVTYEQTFGDLGLEAGLRVEDTRWTLDQMTSGEVVGQDYVKVFPTLHLSYQLDDASKLTGSFSLRLQRPPSILLNPRVYVNDPQNIQVGNPDLQPTSTASYELGYQRRISDQDVQANLFYRDIRDEFVPAVLVVGGGVFAN
jgi:outer membrane receptor protein involved in Fe transport